VSITSWAHRRLWSRRVVTAFKLLTTGQFISLFKRLRLFILNRLNRKKPPKYSEWRKKWVQIEGRRREEILNYIDRLEHKPSFTFLISLEKTQTELLEKTITCLINQLYPNWVLHISCSENTDALLIDTVEKFKDTRIKITSSESRNFGDWICQLELGIILNEVALFAVVESTLLHEEALVVYSDHDHLSANGEYIDPYMKPDWNPDLLKATNYFFPFVLFHNSLWGNFSIQQNNLHELSLSATKNLKAKEILHISSVLATVQVSDSKTHLLPQIKKIKETIPNPLPLVSILIPTKNQGLMLERCLNSLRDKTDYSNFEVIVIDHESTEKKALEVLKRFNEEPDNHLLSFSGSFNFSSMMNHASSKASGEILLLLNNDTEVIESNWLKEMVTQVVRPEVGVVGAMLFFANGNIQHAGINPGVDGFMGHSHKNWPGDTPGYFGRLLIPHEVAAVTGACLAVEKENWNLVGGFDENLAVAYNDVDFCFKIRKNNLRVILTPLAHLIHHESVSRGFDDSPRKQDRLLKELSIIRDKWGDFIHEDPAYNPNLGFEFGGFHLADRPRKIPSWFIKQE